MNLLRTAVVGLLLAGSIASSQPFSEYKRKPGDRVGHNWRMPNVHGKRAVRYVVYDTNYWKTFVHARLTTCTKTAK